MSIIDFRIIGKYLYAAKKLHNNPAKREYYKLSTWTKASDVTMYDGSTAQDTISYLDSEFHEAVNAYSEVTDYGVAIDPSDSLEDVEDALKHMEDPIIESLGIITGEDVSALQTIDDIDTFLQTKYEQIVAAVSACGVTIPSDATIDEIAELFLESQLT